MEFSWENILGLVAGICTTISVVPQIRKAWKSKQVEDVSPGMFTILMIGVGLWVVYGIVKQDLPIIATNGVSLGLNSVMMYLMIRYRNKDEDKD